MISVALVNGSQVQSNGVTHKSNRKSDDKMLNEHKKWERKLEEKRPSLSPVGIKNMQEEIDEFAREIRRFEFGIEIINDYSIIMKSFVNMNRTFLKTSKKYSTWRLFQILYRSGQTVQHTQWFVQQGRRAWCRP